MTFTAKDIFKIEVAPALGCTEPVAIALGAAACASLAQQDELKSLNVLVSPNIYKNGIAVSIPGTDGLSGLDLSSALGAFGGDPLLRLEVLGPVDDNSKEKAVKFVQDKNVSVKIAEDKTGVYIKTILTAGNNTYESVIEDIHDNIVSLKINQKQVKNSNLVSKDSKVKGSNELFKLEAWLKQKSLADLLDFVDDFDREDLDFLEKGVEYNLALADYGLKHGVGLGIGKALQRMVRLKLLNNDMVLASRILTSAAADARMSGVKLPAMSSAGSGNHGLTAILPIWAVKDFVDVDKDIVLKAIGLSHIVTAYVKAYTGRLSAVCGCSVAAGAGATVGVTYLLGGDITHISGSVKNLTEDLAGVICDGAKAGCALKLVTAAGAAVQAALFSLQGVVVEATDGIISDSPEQTMQNIGILSTKGMIETDRTILKIMVDKSLKPI
ncbi:MAG: serine dehydratase subunit alpha family protein [Desulfobacteraceae bacterium]|nr:serine dehydratase subunit alpha family protein [Desulfobacteraceae bacterium]